MKKIKNKINKICLILCVLILNTLIFMNSSQATQINTAQIYEVNDCGQLLKYKGSIVIVKYVQYDNEGVSYPAYCLDKTKQGAEGSGYSVSVDKAITDVGLWRVLINGYPYKTIEELGVANKEEAFTATKQAVYCAIYDRDPNTYIATDEIGERTKNEIEYAKARGKKISYLENKKSE